jgi:hypothetical protein
MKCGHCGQQLEAFRRGYCPMCEVRTKSSRKVKAAKRIVLGVGHPYFVKGSVSLWTADCSGEPVPLKFRDVGGYNKVRLVLEILK